MERIKNQHVIGLIRVISNPTKSSIAEYNLLNILTVRAKKLYNETFKIIK